MENDGTASYLRKGLSAVPSSFLTFCIAQCNQLLRENGFPRQLHAIGNDSFDLTIILFYGSEQEVSALEKIIQ